MSIGGTNRPDAIDPAVRRLDRSLFISIPTSEDRVEIIMMLTKKAPLVDDVGMTNLGKDSRCEGFSGADLYHLVREAATVALRLQLLKGQ